MARTPSPSAASVKSVVKLIADSPEGLRRPEIAAALGVGIFYVGSVIRSAKNAGKVVQHGGGASLVWCTPAVARALKKIAADEKLARTARARALGRGKKCVDPTVPWHASKMSQQTVKAWAPVRRAPGPASVFHLAAQ